MLFLIEIFSDWETTTSFSKIFLGSKIRKLDLKRVSNLHVVKELVIIRAIRCLTAGQRLIFKKLQPFKRESKFMSSI